MDLNVSGERPVILTELQAHLQPCLSACSRRGLGTRLHAPKTVTERRGLPILSAATRIGTQDNFKTALQLHSNFVPIGPASAVSLPGLDSARLIEPCRALRATGPIYLAGCLFAWTADVGRAKG